MAINNMAKTTTSVPYIIRMVFAMPFDLELSSLKSTTKDNTRLAKNDNEANNDMTGSTDDPKIVKVSKLRPTPEINKISAALAIGLAFSPSANCCFSTFFNARIIRIFLNKPGFLTLAFWTILDSIPFVVSSVAAEQ